MGFMKVMYEKKKLVMSKEDSIDVFHIDVLDGLRVLAIVIVIWYHFWQLSFLMPIGFGINLDWLPRTGWIMVDFMVLLSGFCLFLPHARSMIRKEPIPDTKLFYKKRMARIFPSYYLCVFVVLFFFALPNNSYFNEKHMWQDLIGHLTFTHNMSKNAFFHTRLNGVLWTMAIEVQFYVIFPFLAKLFRRKPFITYFGMVMISLLYLHYSLQGTSSMQLQMRLVQLPAYLCVFANGMLGAVIVVSLAKKDNEDFWNRVLFTIIAVFCIFVYRDFMKDLCKVENIEIWKGQNRYIISILFLVFIISCIFAIRSFRIIFANRIMRFVASISLNWYMWHQLIGATLKDWKVPYWSGDVPPNLTGDKIWMWKYFILIWSISFLFAVITTYVIEKPIAKWILRRKS